MSEYLLPDVGEGLTEAEIVSWKVKVGDVVAVNDVVVEIETAKSLVELPSPYAGTVLALLVPEGETVPVGTPMVRIGDPAAAGGAPAARGGGGEAEGGVGGAAGPGAAGPGGPAAAPIDTNVPPEGTPTLVGYGPRERGAQRRARRTATPVATGAGVATTHEDVQDAFVPGGGHHHAVEETDEAAVPAVDRRTGGLEGGPRADGSTTDASPGTVRALAKPPVRKLAKDLGVDLVRVAPSGPGGTVTRSDVEAAAGIAAPAPAGPAAGGLVGGSGALAAGGRRGGEAGIAGADRERREPVKGVRKMMAQAMVDSAFTAPHVTEWVTVDVTRTMELVERLRSRRELADVKVSPLLVLARAVVLAMRRTPEVNSTWDEAAQEVVFKSYVNLGIAAATPRGLVVPNLKEAQAMSLAELGAALAELTRTAREGRTTPAEMSGGTFTITNVGVFGVDSGTPIINPGESAILCFGAIRKQPWVVAGASGDELAIRQVTTLALSFDHRHIDGEKGSRFLADVAGILEDPASALLF